MPQLPQPEIVEAPARELLALARGFSMETRYEIPNLWGAFHELNFGEGGVAGRALYGASFDMQPDGQFKYAVGIVADPAITPPNGTCTVNLRAGTYAVFRFAGPYNDIPMMFDAIFTDRLPGSSWGTAVGAVFERYPAQPAGQDHESIYEIWVPVIPKGA